MAKALVRSGVGVLVTAPDGGIVSPTNPTITGVSVIDINSTSDGRAQKQITISYTPGSIGTGINVFVDHPDSSGTLPIADGTVAADGTTQAVGTFSPEFIGPFPYDPTNLSVVIYMDPPPQPQFWRVYFTPLANTTQTPVVQYGKPGASPSWQFEVDPPRAVGQGREFAPLVLSPALSSVPSGWATNPNIVVQDSGDQFFEYRVTWEWPTLDPNFQTLGGVNVVLDDGVTRTVYDQIWVPANVKAGVASVEADALSSSGHIPVPAGGKSYKVYLASFNKESQVNTFVQGFTPTIAFSITRNTGVAGQEYCAVVSPDSTHPLVTVAYVSGADGTSLMEVTGYFNRPSDPAFGGVEIVALKPDGIYYHIQSGRLSPVQNDVSQPATVQSWTFYLRSIDINGRPNSISALTPSITLNVGNASGVLNLSKAASSTFTSEFQITGGQLALGNVSATSIVTGILQVGGGGSKTSQMKIFDTLGSIIGFIGDDTGGTGYVGAWFKKVAVGGTSPSSAPLTTDPVTGNLTLTNGNIISTSGTSSASMNAAIIDVEDSALFLRAQMLTGAFFAQSISSHYNGQMALNLWSLLFTNGNPGSAAVEIGTTTGSTPYFVKMAGTQVLTQQQTGPGNPSFSSLSDAQTWCQNLITKIRVHGFLT